ncbi:hypothetical protein [Streptomyces sp. NPDC005799]|uniref:hypothetical protein n=1 Tax=Streptomyces sp. NPDC005799 TaxID=3154678 RepID=UPI003410220B
MTGTQTPYERMLSRAHTRWLERKTKELMSRRIREMTARLRAEHVTVHLDNSGAVHTSLRPLVSLMSHDASMTNYDGPATVTVDGAQHEVTARLIATISGGLTEWHGTLEAQTEEAA